MKEMEEMNKAFDDVVSLCDKTIKACQDFRNMDINKTTEPSLETQRDEVATLRRDDLPTVEQNARLFRSLGRLQRKAQGKKVWR